MEEFVVGFIVVNVETMEVGIPLNEENSKLHGTLLDGADVFRGAIEVRVVDHDVVAIDEYVDAFNGVDGAGVVEVDGVENGAESAALRTAADISLPGR